MTNRCPSKLIDQLVGIYDQLDQEEHEVSRYHVWDAINALAASAPDKCPGNAGFCPSCGEAACKLWLCRPTVH